MQQRWVELLKYATGIVLHEDALALGKLTLIGTLWEFLFDSVYPVVFALHSVVENKEDPSCELEKVVWETDNAVQVARETMPFLMLKGRVMAMPKARGTRFVEFLKQPIDSSSDGVLTADAPRVISGRAYKENDTRLISSRVVVGFSHEIPRLRNAAADAATMPLFFARDLVVLPYQVFSVRVKGGDSIVLQAAVWPMRDIVYQSKIVLMLGMACIVELHTTVQVEEFLEVRPTVSALLLSARDSQSLQGSAESFATLFQPHREQLMALQIPLLAEAHAEEDPAQAATACAGADAVFCEMPLLR